jgi:hypothetical protein
LEAAENEQFQAAHIERHSRSECVDTSAKTPKEKSADISVSVTVNGRVCTIMVEPRMTLLDALREEPALTGTKKGCDAIAVSAEHAPCMSTSAAGCRA